MKAEQSVHLQYLMFRFFEGSITEDEFRVLNQMIKEDAETQKLYFSYLKVYLSLKNARYLNSDCQSSLEAEDILAEFGHYENLAPAVEIQEPLKDAIPVYLEKQKVAKAPYQFNKYSFYTALTTLAATVLIIAGIYFLPPRIVPDPVARILDSTQAEWIQEKSAKNRSILFTGPLSVTRGTLKIAMYDGTEVILKAPAVVELEQIDRLYLQRGTVRATVPPVAAGFTVCTPCGSIVDYGTEFMVDVDKTGAASVEVFKGIVELRDSTNPLLFKVAQKLIAGQSGRIDPAGKISFRDASRPDNNTEIRVVWENPTETGYWAKSSSWTNGMVRGKALVSEFRAKDGPKRAIIDSNASGANKIVARRADVGLLSQYPFTVEMKGGQIQLEQLWVGRMSTAETGQGRWIMEEGDVLLKGRDLVVLLVGDKGKGWMELNGGTIEAMGTTRIGCMQGDGTLIVNGGQLLIDGFLEVAIEDSVGTVHINGGVVEVFDIRVDKKGSVLMSGGLLIMQGDKTERIQQLIDEGSFKVGEDQEIQVQYSRDNTFGYGVDKTIVSIKE